MCRVKMYQNSVRLTVAPACLRQPDVNKCSDRTHMLYIRGIMVISLKACQDLKRKIFLLFMNAVLLRNVSNSYYTE